jgi:hypothetical protein
VDEKINQVVTEYIESSKIIIQCKGKVGKNANRFLIGILYQPFNPIPGKDFDLDIGVLGDIGSIIKMEGDVKRIGVG